MPLKRRLVASTLCLSLAAVTAARAQTQSSYQLNTASGLDSFRVTAGSDGVFTPNTVASSLDSNGIAHPDSTSYPLYVYDSQAHTDALSIVTALGNISSGGSGTGGATAALQTSIGATAHTDALNVISTLGTPLPLPTGAATAAGVTQLHTDLTQTGGLPVAGPLTSAQLSAANLATAAGQATLNATATSQLSLEQSRTTVVAPGGASYLATVDLGMNGTTPTALAVDGVGRLQGINNCTVVSTDTAYALSSFSACTQTAAGRQRVGLPSSMTTGSTAATSSDLAGATDPSGNQQSLRVNAASSLLVARPAVTYVEALVAIPATTWTTVFTGSTTTQKLLLGDAVGLSCRWSVATSPTSAQGLPFSSSQPGTQEFSDPAPNNTVKVYCTTAGSVTVESY